MDCRELPGSSDNISSGDGPERAVFQEVIRLLLRDRTCWNPTDDGSSWAQPVWSPVLSRELQVRWRTTGTFMLLYLLTLGNGPEPISPMLLYLLLAGAVREGHSLDLADSEIELGTLYKLDTGIAESLRPWMVLKGTDQLTGFTRLPPQLMPLQFLLARCNYQVRMTLQYSMNATKL